MHTGVVHGALGHGKHQNPTGFGKKKGLHPTGVGWENFSDPNGDQKLHKYWSFCTKHKAFMITLSKDGGSVRICERTRLFGYEIGVTIDAAAWMIEILEELKKKNGQQRAAFKRFFRNSSGSYFMEFFSNSNGAFLKISTLKNNKIRMVIIPEETAAKGWSELYKCLSGVLKRKPDIVHGGVTQQKERKLGECRMNTQSWVNIVKRSGKHDTKSMGGNVVKKMEKMALKGQHNKNDGIRDRGKVEWRELYPEINLGFKPKNLYPEKRFYQPKFYEYMRSKAHPKDWSLAVFLARDNTHADWSTIFYNLSRELGRKLIVSQLFDDRCITWCKDEKEKEELVKVQRIFHGWFNTCWYQDFDHEKVFGEGDVIEREKGKGGDEDRIEEEKENEEILDNCVIMIGEKENREYSAGEVGGDDDSVEADKVEGEMVAVDDGEEGQSEVEKPEQRRVEAINESTGTEAGSRLLRVERQGSASPKVGRKEDRESINIQRVFSRILNDLSRPPLIIPRTCPFLFIKDTWTMGGITAQLDVGPRNSVGRKGLIENRAFNCNRGSDGDSREISPLMYFHNGPFSIVLAHKRKEIRPELKSFNLKIQTLDPWVSKGKEEMAICLKKNTEQIIKDFFEGKLKSIKPKSRKEFRAATIMFWADFEVIKKSVKPSILEKTAEVEQDEEKGFVQFGKVYIRKRKSMGHTRVESAVLAEEEFYFEGEEADVESFEEEMLGLSSESECSEGEGVDPEAEDSEEQEDIIGDIKELWRQNDNEKQLTNDYLGKGQNTRQIYHEDHSWSNIVQSMAEMGMEILHNNDDNNVIKGDRKPMRKKYLDFYTNKMSPTIHDYVTSERNCEDIAMSLLIANSTSAPPIWVKGKIYETGSTGISSMKGHSNRRSKCLNDFISLYGKMPLVSTHVKAVDARQEWFCIFACKAMHSGFGSALSLFSSLVFEGFPFSGIEVISSAMEEILKKTHNLQVTDEDEEWEVDKSLSITIARYNLRGRLCTNSDHSRGFLKKSIQSRILSKMPWYLSNGVLILGKMENSNESWKNDLTSFPIWGRAWGVPTDLLTTKNTTRMAAKAGEVISVYNSDPRQAPTSNHGRNTISNSVPLCDTMEVVSTGGLDHNQLQQNTGKNSQYSPQNITVKARNDGKEDVQKQCEDGSRGKRRIVEDYGDSEYGKLKKSATILAKETQDQDLYNVPVSYTQDALVLDGSTPFAVGSSSKNIAKETRRRCLGRGRRVYSHCAIGLGKKPAEYEYKGVEDSVGTDWNGFTTME
ncbi:hypothetical protein G4B88_013105 [Cannabis sativa]|uniref:Glycosyl transferase 64 domain-containing protein n=1 Tax=Cannabis sativa TaxID=3483 RepID=A0A7J6I482_CANSA|nr:hypothetical protein G4B88_013105 [Cannabis sativa]